MEVVECRVACIAWSRWLANAECQFTVIEYVSVDGIEVEFLLVAECLCDIGTTCRSPLAFLELIRTAAEFLIVVVVECIQEWSREVVQIYFSADVAYVTSNVLLVSSALAGSTVVALNGQLIDTRLQAGDGLVAVVSSVVSSDHWVACVHSLHVGCVLWIPSPSYVTLVEVRVEDEGSHLVALLLIVGNILSYLVVDIATDVFAVFSVGCTAFISALHLH